ncbi:hypothetical protein [Zavarzinia sp.]|uniref:hypothetical protein n=1 Tax=Zavarzinia sp. TaxID=2027920 RepID=UPI00356514B3
MSIVHRRSHIEAMTKTTQGQRSDLPSSAMSLAELRSETFGAALTAAFTRAATEAVRQAREAGITVAGDLPEGPTAAASAHALVIKTLWENSAHPDVRKGRGTGRTKLVRSPGHKATGSAY